MYYMWANRRFLWLIQGPIYGLLCYKVDMYMYIYMYVYFLITALPCEVIVGMSPIYVPHMLCC